MVLIWSHVVFVAIYTLNKFMVSYILKKLVVLNQSRCFAFENHGEAAFHLCSVEEDVHRVTNWLSNEAHFIPLSSVEISPEYELLSHHTSARPR